MEPYRQDPVKRSALLERYVDDHPQQHLHQHEIEVQRMDALGTGATHNREDFVDGSGSVVDASSVTDDDFSINRKASGITALSPRKPTAAKVS